MYMKWHFNGILNSIAIANNIVLIQELNFKWADDDIRLYFSMKNDEGFK